MLEYRFADGRARLPVLAAELVALPVDVIVAVSTPTALAAKAATTTVAIVFLSDPIQGGLVASFAHPGGHLTGYTYGKHIRGKADSVTQRRQGQDLLRFTDISAATARALSVQIQCLNGEDARGLAGALALALTARIEGLVVMEQGWSTAVHYKQIADFTRTHRIPTIGEFPSYMNVGGLLYYGPKPGQGVASTASRQDSARCQARRSARRAAHQVRAAHQPQDREGARPHHPPSVLARADEVIQ